MGHEFVSASEFSVTGVKKADSRMGGIHGQTSGKILGLCAYLLIVVTKQLHGMR